MSYVDVNTPVIEKITLPSGNTYFIADREIRDVVDVLSQTIAGGISYIVAWDGTSTPVVADIPAGVTVVYNGTSYTGTLSANSAQPGAFYLVKSATQTGLKITSDVECTVNINTFRTKTNDATNTTYSFNYNGSSWNPTLAQYGITVQGNPAYGDEIIIETPSDYNNLLDKYDEYVPIGSAGSKEWEKIGDTQIDLSNVVTNVTLNKSTKSVIGSNATFTVTQPTISVLDSVGQQQAEVVVGFNEPIIKTDDNVDVIKTLGTPATKSAIGASSTFTITQPTITLATDANSGTGKVQVVTGISSASASGDSVNAVTGYASPTTDTFLKGVKVTAQPTVSLTANTSSGTGRITYVQSQGSATTTKIKATATGGAVSASGDNVTALTGLGTPSTANVASSVTPTTKKLATTTVTGVSGSTTPDVVKTRSSQTTAKGTGTSSSTNTDWLKGVSVSNGILTIGAATMDTQTTYSAGAPSSITIPTAASSATTVATGSVTTSGSGASVVTDVAVGDTVAAVTGYASPTTDTVLGTASSFSVTNPTVTISSGSTGDVTVATGIGSATTRYLSASASGTAVGADGTGDALTALGDPTTDSVIGSSSTITVTPTKTYIKGTASGANTAWNNKDSVTAVTGYTPTTTNVAIGSARLDLGAVTDGLTATASGANVAWNNKDSTNALTSTTDVSVTKGS